MVTIVQKIYMNQELYLEFTEFYVQFAILYDKLEILHVYFFPKPT